MLTNYRAAHKIGGLLVLTLLATLVAACSDAPAPVPPTVTPSARPVPPTPTAVVITAPVPTTAAPPTTATTANPTATVSGVSVPSNNYGGLPNKTVKIYGQGVYLPDRAFQLWISNYSKGHPAARFDYKLTSSPTSKQNVFQGQLDFAVSNFYPTDKEANANGYSFGNWRVIPTALNGIAVIYNLPGITQLKLSPETLWRIYYKQIIQWNDPKITAENPDQTLPDLPVTLATENQEDEIREIFDDFLKKHDPTANRLSIPSRPPDYKPPVTTDSNHDPAVVNTVQSKPGAIGYVKWGEAKGSGSPMVSLKNSAGNYVAPDLASFAAAAETERVPDNMQIKVLDRPYPAAYPLTHVAWVILPNNFDDVQKATELVNFLWWISHDPDQIAAVKEVGYAPLPSNVVSKIEATLKTIYAAGQPVLK